MENRNTIALSDMLAHGMVIVDEEMKKKYTQSWDRREFFQSYRNGRVQVWIEENSIQILGSGYGVIEVPQVLSWDWLKTLRAWVRDLIVEELA